MSMPTDLKSILRLEVPLIVEIASRRMSMREVASLSPGAIVELPKHASEELEVLVSNQPIGMGAAVKVGENFGVRITYIGDLRQRIRAMGGPELPADGRADEPQPQQQPEAPAESVPAEQGAETEDEQT